MAKFGFLKSGKSFVKKDEKDKDFDTAKRLWNLAHGKGNIPTDDISGSGDYVPGNDEEFIVDGD